jgi:microsomal dipeptidase-like Zn-dependent dipeptidase
VARYVDHIDYITKRIGWEHVGIGTEVERRAPPHDGHAGRIREVNLMRSTSKNYEAFAPSL